MAVPSEALSRLERVLAGLDGLVVAYSGGVDSTLLALAAHRVLGPRSLAVTVETPVAAPGERKEAQELAAALGFGLRTVSFDWLAVPELVENSAERCYRCKRRIMTLLLAVAGELGFSYVADGTNVDDHAENRPGLWADLELGVHQPLYEAGLDKQAVRLLAFELGLPNAAKPSSPCLATRVPTGRGVTAAALDRVAQGEAALHTLGFPVVRVRDLFPHGVVEVPPERVDDLYRMKDEVLRALRSAGYRRVALDLAGYGSGPGA
ncbi:MAG TPA: ATP-dependent sacrificial sulfur transferase LarE [Spirochaetia bacterium]|nr:ATP-dependent sacrificial sulfur transferase LarE [Spirochaetia bacterium]